jgi:CHAT domain-containing protein
MHAHDTIGGDITAELVVLSACQSGLSLVMEGDEWMGLPRAFLRAGAARVLASLWDVDDRATRELMSAFAIALKSSPEKPAEALRSAQVQIIEQHPHPYFWAGFAMLGTP